MGEDIATLLDLNSKKHSGAALKHCSTSAALELDQQMRVHEKLEFNKLFEFLVLHADTSTVKFQLMQKAPKAAAAECLGEFSCGANEILDQAGLTLHKEIRIADTDIFLCVYLQLRWLGKSRSD